VLTADDRRLAAYHEAGHALVNLLLPGLDPVQKVSIVPRGRALGITYAVPEQERRTQTRAYLLGRLAIAYGGRAAEELVFGADRITTGAANDFQQATELARRMVTEFGMSDAVGPIAVSEHPEPAPWGWAALPRREVSPHTAELVDREIRRLVDEAHHQASEVLASHRAALDALADALLARETLEGAEIQAIVAGAATAPPPARAAELAGVA
jgi:cell division protease FtsH